ncbi:MAG: class I SAM-dependent methyltransferase [Ignavibacteria bacterium]|nr:class I SAM-dependent methyltransferase [Ignavibacteria bacterium]
MKIENPEKRLNQFWGEVDKKHIQSIADYVTGNKILDMGCGLGTTTNYITNSVKECIGIDYDNELIDYCKTTYPNCKYLVADAEKLPFDDNSFDTIILRDALHHFFGEADFDKVKSEILRVAKSNARIIFFDPNVNFLLKTMRKLSSHVDEECNYETAIEIMNDMGFKIIHHSFNTVYSLPLSGGYVGINFIPSVKLFYKIVLRTENVYEWLINKLGLGRHLCWRYLIVGKR